MENENQTFKISRGLLLYAPRPEDGQVTLHQGEKSSSVDLVAHLFESPRMKDEYRPILFYSPLMHTILQEVAGAIDGRKPIGKRSALGKKIVEVLKLVDEMRVM